MNIHDHSIRRERDIEGENHFCKRKEELEWSKFGEHTLSHPPKLQEFFLCQPMPFDLIGQSRLVLGQRFFRFLEALVASESR